MITAYTALKVNYNRSTRTRELEVVRNADLMMIHAGYFVYETANPDQALKMIKAGKCLTGKNWENARLAIIGFLGME